MNETSKPFCSVLLPSKWRFEKLLKAVSSFYETAKPEDFEMLIRLHDSDNESLPRENELYTFGGNVKVIHGRDKLPGEGNNICWNDLLPIANGVWHQYWSDDMIISGDWVGELRKVPLHGFIAHPEFHQLGPNTYPNNCGGPVPFIPADALPKYGFDLIPDPPDTAIDQILRGSNQWKCCFLKGVRVWHDRQADRTLPIA